MTYITQQLAGLLMVRCNNLKFLIKGLYSVIKVALIKCQTHRQKRRFAELTLLLAAGELCRYVLSNVRHFNKWRHFVTPI